VVVTSACAARPKRTVRDVSSLGTQSGWERQFCANTIGLKAVGVVRTDRVSGRKSSKRVQTGEAQIVALRSKHFSASSLRKCVKTRFGIQDGTACL
jgi:hypothetical protein